MYLTDMQVQEITSLINIDVCGGKILLVVKTGAGKSHVMRATGVLLGGVCLIIMPLLALRSDQVAKLCMASQQAYGAVNYYHLDEHQDCPQTMNLILSQVDACCQDTTLTVFLFSSPQLTFKNHIMRNCLLKAHSKSILKSFFMRFTCIWTMVAYLFATTLLV
jgi:superfamily II DNA helicase RecQ